MITILVIAGVAVLYVASGLLCLAVGFLIGLAAGGHDADVGSVDPSYEDALQ